MIRSVLLALTVLAVVSCAKLEGCVELGGEFRLWIVSANERYLTNEDDVYLLGPRIEAMALSGGYIFGKNPEFAWDPLTNTPGYFFIDSATGGLQAGLSADEFKDRLKTHNIENYELTGPGEIMKKRRRDHLCGAE